MNPVRSLLLGLGLAVSGTSALVAQNPATPSMPSDPVELMQLAAQRNGLDGPGLKPWHLKATYQTYDDKGKPAEQGTFEEWWAAPGKYKISFDRPSSKMTIYANHGNLYLDGAKELDYFQTRILSTLGQPIAHRDLSPQHRFVREIRTIGSAKLACVTVFGKGGNPWGLPASAFPSYCFDLEKPILRLSASNAAGDVIFNRIGSLEDRYVPVDATVALEGKNVLTLHAVSAETPAQFDDAIFAIPAGANADPQATDTSREAEATYTSEVKVSGQEPQYPSEAKMLGAQGVVIVSAVLNPDGSLQDVQAMSSSSPFLIGPATRAVKTWHYKPALLSGHPIAIQMRVPIVFLLGRRS